MTSHAGHVGEELQDLVDGRLAESRRAEIESHLAGCADCQAQRQALTRLKLALKERRGEAPAGLRDQMADAIARGGRTASRSRRRLAVAAALVAGLIAAAILWRAPVTADLPEEAAQALAGAREGRPPIERPTSQPAELEEFFRTARPGIRTRVFDLGMMGWQLTGGSAATLGQHPSALFVYVTPDGRMLLCQMYSARWEDLPASEGVHSSRGFTFHVYRRGETRLVFWKEAGLICVLAGDLPESEILALAVAKAS